MNKECQTRRWPLAFGICAILSEIDCKYRIIYSVSNGVTFLNTLSMEKETSKQQDIYNSQ